MDDFDECDHCGQREYIFRGESTLDDFCLWLFSEENYDSTVLCHNFQRYDSYPILQYLYKNAIVPTIIPNGAKIMSLTIDICKIKMIDSINFLPMALSKLPQMFGFEELKKGYFPHLFNRKENQDIFLDRLPELAYYNPDAMKPQTCGVRGREVERRPCNHEVPSSSPRSGSQLWDFSLASTFGASTGVVPRKQNRERLV